MKDFVREIASRVNYATDLLEENPLMKIVRPKGAYYIFPKIDLSELKFKSDKEFVHSLLKEEGVQIAWGSGFGEPSHLRIVALAPKETLKLAIEKMDRFCRRHKK
jgi:alanine-synthesizing transaminase